MGYVGGIDVQPGRSGVSYMTSEDIITAYMQDIDREKTEKSMHSRQTRRGRFEQYIQENDVELLDLDGDDIYLYINYLKNDGLADQTIIGYTQFVFNLCEFLLVDPRYDPSFDDSILERDYYEEQNIDLDSPEYIKRRKRQDKKNIKSIDLEHIKAVATYTIDPQIRNELIIRLLWQTALRAEELARIKIGNIDFDKREIEIRSAKLEPKHELYTRKVFYHENLDFLMDKYRNYERPRYKSAEDSDYLFVSRKSEKISSGIVSRIVRESAKRAEKSGEYDFTVQEQMYTDSQGNPRYFVTAHRIRHSAISYWANVRELPIHQIRMMAGHEDIQTTMGYISTDWEDVRETFQYQ